MRLERGRIYELGDDWGCVRALNFFQEYETFNPDVKEEQYVRVVKPGTPDHSGGDLFRMKREMFEELVVEDHGFSLPDSYTPPERSE